MRLWLAIRCFFLILFTRRLPADAALLLAEAPPTPGLPPPARDPERIRVEERPHREAVPAASQAGALQLLTLFQREGRLLDFLQEDVDSYSDAQVGAAVRDIHRGCRKALAEHMPVEPVLAQGENSQVRVDPGFDPSRIRLVGNVVGEPPFTGALRHHGWRIAKVELPAPAKAADPTVVAPAEVELA